MINDNKRKTTVTWHRIVDGRADIMPDPGIQVLIYDQDLNDVCLGSLDKVNGELFWVELTIGEALPNPLWWAEIPLPAL